MRDGGKGDTPRPLSVPKEQFDNNWDAIFNKATAKVFEGCDYAAEAANPNGVTLNSALHPETEGPPTHNVFHSIVNSDSLETIEIEVKK